MDDYQDKLTIVIPETQDHDEGKHQTSIWLISISQTYHILNTIKLVLCCPFLLKTLLALTHIISCQRVHMKQHLNVRACGMTCDMTCVTIGDTGPLSPGRAARALLGLGLAPHLQPRDQPQSPQSPPGSPASVASPLANNTLLTLALAKVGHYDCKGISD